MILIPNVIYNKDGRQEYRADIYSRLLEAGNIFLTGEVNDIMASNFLAQIIYIRNDCNLSTIRIYINSPGGAVYSCFGMVDVIRSCIGEGATVHTICYGMAASAGSILLSSGSLGFRAAFKNAYIMIHQPSGGTSGTSKDISIYAKQIEKIRTKLATMYHTHGNGKRSVEEYMLAIDRDNYLDSSSAMEMGIIDQCLN